MELNVSVDKVTGTLKINSSIVISASLQKSQLIQQDWSKGAAPLTANGPWVFYKLQPIRVGNQHLYVGLSFKDQTLHNVEFSFSLPNEPKEASHRDWSLEKELDRNDFHDTFICQQVGYVPISLPWGDVSSSYDERSRASSIRIKYKHDNQNHEGEMTDPKIQEAREYLDQLYADLHVQMKGYKDGEDFYSRMKWEINLYDAKLISSIKSALIFWLEGDHEGKFTCALSIISDLQAVEYIPKIEVLLKGIKKGTFRWGAGWEDFIRAVLRRLREANRGAVGKAVTKKEMPKRRRSMAFILCGVCCFLGMLLALFLAF